MLVGPPAVLVVEEANDREIRSPLPQAEVTTGLEIADLRDPVVQRQERRPDLLHLLLGRALGEPEHHHVADHSSVPRLRRKRATAPAAIASPAPISGSRRRRR